MAESGLDLVENEHRPISITQAPKLGKISGKGMDDTDVLKDRLCEHGGDGVAIEDIFERADVVEINDVYPVACLRWRAGGERKVGVFSGRNPRPKLFQGRHNVTGDLVIPAVVAPLHNND